MTRFRDRIAASFWTQMAVILLLAAGVRGVYMVQSSGNPTFANPIIDAATYDLRARELALEGRLDQEILWQAPLYPVFLAGVYRLFGVSLLAVHVIQALLGCLTCLLVALLGRRVFGPVPGLVAGLIYALYGPAVFFESELLSAGWASFLAVALLLLLLQAGQAPRWGRILGLGLVSALAVLVRSTFLPFLLIATIWLILSWRRQGAAWPLLARRFGLLLAGWLLVLGPVGELTRRVAGRPVLLPPSGGVNLYIGNNPDFEGTINTRPGREWSRMRALPEQDGLGDDVWSRQAWYLDQVKRFAREHPGEFAAGLARKTLHFISSRELPRNVDIYLMSHWSALLRGLVWRWGPFGFPFGVLLPLAALGLAVRWREVPGPLKLFLLLFSLTIVGFFVSARYRLVITPVLAVLAGAGATSLVAWIRSHSWRKLGWTAAAGTVLILLITLPGPFAQEKIDLEPELYFAVGYGHFEAERWPEAETELRRALRLRPDFPEAHNYLGIALYRQNRPAEAVRHFVEANRLDPRFSDALSSLQVVAQEKAECLAEAWMRATSSDPAVRDGARAVYFANRAAALSLRADPCVTGVRAAAFAEAGEAEQAAALAALVLDSLSGDALSDCEPISPQFAEALAVIREGNPFRE